MPRIIQEGNLFFQRKGRRMVPIMPTHTQPTNGTVYTKSHSWKEDYIYVSTINLWVSLERTYLQNQNWFDYHMIQNQGIRMHTLSEGIEYLKYFEANHQEIYKDIAEINPEPWRLECFDTIIDCHEGTSISSEHTYEEGKIVPRYSETLDEDTLTCWKMISLKDYMARAHTRQGLPRKDVKEGNFFYEGIYSPGIWVMGTHNHPYLGIHCPYNRNPILGVRTVRTE